MLRDKGLCLFNHIFYTVMLIAEAYYFPKAEFDSSKGKHLLACMSQDNLQSYVHGTLCSAEHLEQWFAGAG